MSQKLKTKVKGYIVKYIFASGITKPLEFLALFLSKNFAYRLKFYRWVGENSSKFKFIDQGLDAEKHYSFVSSVSPERRYNLYKFLLESEGLKNEIDYLEFGVAEGASIKWWAEHNHNPLSRFTGFDVFTGLPEKWGNKAEGTFSTGGKIPHIDDNRCSFEKGLFQDTLIPHLRGRKLHHKTVIHLDADLYSSTIFVLKTLAPKLKVGDIFIFDEFNSFLHEFKALEEFARDCSVSYDLLGAANGYSQIALKLV